VFNKETRCDWLSFSKDALSPPSGPWFAWTDDYCILLSPQPSRSSFLSPLLVYIRPANMETWLYTPMFAYAAKPILLAQYPVSSNGKWQTPNG
jgi:hypothetical protein